MSLMLKLLRPCSTRLCGRHIRNYEHFLPATRAFASMKPQKEKFVILQTKLMEKDGVPFTYSLIYKAPMVFSITIISWMSSVMAVLVSGMTAVSLLLGSHFDMESEFVVGDVIFAENMHQALAFAGLFVAMTVAMRFIASRYVMRMYRENNDYIAVSKAWFGGMRHRHFQAGEATRSSGGEFRIKGKLVVILTDYFKTHHECLRMLDYLDDKDLQ